MFGRKKGFSTAHSKRMSKRMDAAMIGSHVKRPESDGDKSGSSTSGTDQVGFSGGRHLRGARHGYVDHVGVSASSGEDDSAYSRRIAQPGYIQEVQRKHRRRRVLLIVAIAAIVVIVAVAVGVAVYFTSSDSKLAGGLNNANEALVSADEGQPYYVLCAAELDSAGSVQGASTDAYLLVRVDENNKVLTFLNIPANLSVQLSDGETHPLYDAVEIGGQSELIEQVSQFAGVDVSHFVWTNADQLAGMVDVLGGIDIDVTVEVDDPYAGTQVLYPGEQALDSDTALIFLRATNFQDGFEQTAENRSAFMESFFRTALTKSGLDFATLVGDAGDYISTDFTSAQLLSLGDAFREFDQVTIYDYVVPGSEISGDVQLFSADSSEWDNFKNAFSEGVAPEDADESVASVVPAEITVEVLNGADVAGAAANMASILEAAGYVVSNVGNVSDATTYPETLVIYNDEAYEPAAKAVVEAINGGRVVQGGDYYTLTTNVLVIIGQDWIPMI